MATPIAFAGPGGRPALATALKEAGFALEDPTDLKGWLGESGPRALVVPLRSPADVDRLTGIRAAYPDVVAVAELAFPTAHTFREAIRAGALGVVPAGASPDDVADILQAAMIEQVLVPLALLGAFLRS
jgi:DNA-binding NarL/FixJ family response regulator